MSGRSAFLQQSCRPGQLDVPAQAQSVSFQKGNRNLQLQLFQYNFSCQVKQTGMSSFIALQYSQCMYPAVIISALRTFEISNRIE